MNTSASDHLKSRRRTKNLPPERIKLSKTQLLFLSAAFIICLCGCFISLKILSAQISNYQTNSWLEHWVKQSKENKNFAISDEDYLIAYSSAQLAIQKQPLNITYLENITYVEDWFLIYGDKTSPLFAKAKISVLEHLRKGTQLRPKWPESWIFLADAKAKQLQIDKEFNNAFIKSLELGPWNEEVQYIAAALSFKLYFGVLPKVRKKMRENWSAMYQHQPTKLIKLTTKYKGFKKACPYFNDPHLKQCLYKI